MSPIIVVMLQPNGQHWVDPSGPGPSIEFMRKLPVRKVPYIGRVQQRILKEVLEIETAGDLYRKRAEVLCVHACYCGLSAHINASMTEFLRCSPCVSGFASGMPHLQWGWRSLLLAGCSWSSESGELASRRTPEATECELCTPLYL